MPRLSMRSPALAQMTMMRIMTSVFRRRRCSVGIYLRLKLSHHEVEGRKLKGWRLERGDRSSLGGAGVRSKSSPLKPKGAAPKIQHGKAPAWKAASGQAGS